MQQTKYYIPVSFEDFNGDIFWSSRSWEMKVQKNKYFQAYSKHPFKESGLKKLHVLFSSYFDGIKLNNVNNYLQKNDKQAFEHHICTSGHQILAMSRGCCTCCHRNLERCSIRELSHQRLRLSFGDLYWEVQEFVQISN
jgi:hypothetical protein